MDHVAAELYFLEALRGRPGIPRLYGAYRDSRGAPVLVVEDGGSPLTAFPRGGGKPEPSDAWRAFVRRDARNAARILLECFRSVVEWGGFYVKDFNPHQFTLRNGRVYLVDGPDALDGPVAKFLGLQPEAVPAVPTSVDGSTPRLRS